MYKQNNMARVLIKDMTQSISQKLLVIAALLVFSFL